MNYGALYFYFYSFYVIRQRCAFLKACVRCLFKEEWCIGKSNSERCLKWGGKDH